MKRCSKCGVEKALMEFHSDKSKKDGKNPRCKECHRERFARYYKENSEKVKTKNTKWFQKNPEKARAYVAKWHKKNAERLKAYKAKYREDNLERLKANSRKWFDDNPGAARSHALRRKYGLTPEAWLEMYEAQGGCCLICQNSFSENRKHIHVDHNHDTAEVRGLLCGNCNKALGLLGEDPNTLARAVKYLQGKLQRSQLCLLRVVK